MSNNIRISQLNILPSVTTSDDFIPLVDSSSLTTYRVSITNFGGWFAQSGSVLSASWCSASYTSSHLNPSLQYSASGFTSSFVGNMTGSFFGTASRSVTASFSDRANVAVSASWASASYVSRTAVSASWASASYVSRTAVSASWASESFHSQNSDAAISASWASASISASHAETSSYALSASYSPPLSAADTTPIQFTSLITTAGTYTWYVPTGVTKLSVVCVGAGGGGGYNGGDNSGTGGAGGSGGTAVSPVLTVIPGQSVAITVGAGGYYGDGQDSRVTTPVAFLDKTGSSVISIIGQGGKGELFGYRSAGLNSGSYNTIVGFDGQKGPNGGGFRLYIGGTSSYSVLQPGSTYGQGGVGEYGAGNNNHYSPTQGSSGFVMLRYTLVGS